MNSPHHTNSHRAGSGETAPQAGWLESAVDGLLTLEGERFMLSIPTGVEPNYLAVLRPHIINELAELKRFKRKLMNRLEEMLKPEYRLGLEARIEQRIREELQKLVDWLSTLSNGHFA